MAYVLIAFLCSWMALAYGTDPWENLTKEIEWFQTKLGVTGMAVGIVHNGSTVYQKGFGVRNPQGDPVDTDTVFPIASNSKAFTAFLLAQLANEGKVSLDTPITSQFNVTFSTEELNQKATFVDLLSHRAGFPKDSPFVRSYTNYSDVLKAVHEIPVRFPLRQRAWYSNLGYMLAGALAGVSVNSTWEQLLVSRILEPLGMNSTLPFSAMASGNVCPPTYSIVNGTFMTRPYPGYERVWDEWYQASTSADYLGPAGSIGSNIQDLVKWTQALLNIHHNRTTKVKAPSWPIFNAMWTNQSWARHGDYGMGWQLSNASSYKIVDHPGLTFGHSSHICLMPDLDMAVIVLTNAQLTSAAERVCFASLDYAWNNTMHDVIRAKGPYNGIGGDMTYIPDGLERMAFPAPAPPSLNATGSYCSGFGTMTVTQANGLHHAVIHGQAHAMNYTGNATFRVMAVDVAPRGLFGLHLQPFEVDFSKDKATISGFTLPRCPS